MIGGMNLMGSNNMWYDDIEWEYKGYKCLIEFDVEEDNVKAFHSVTTPRWHNKDGKTLKEAEVVGLILSPYDSKKETVENEVDYHIKNGKFKEHKNG